MATWLPPGDPVEIVAGDDYTAGRALVWIIDDYPGYDVDGAPAEFMLLDKPRYEGDSIKAVFETPATVAQTDLRVTITVELTAEQSRALLTKPPKDDEAYAYQIAAQALDQGARRIVTLADGPLTVRKKIVPVAGLEPPPVWNPGDKPGLRFWGDCSNDVQGVALVGEEPQERVVRIENLGPIVLPVNHYEQVVSIRQPRYLRNFINYRNASQFSELENWHALEGPALGDLVSADAWTILIVFKPQPFNHSPGAPIWNDGPGNLGIFYTAPTAIGLYHWGDDDTEIWIPRIVDNISPPTYLMAAVYRDGQLGFQLNGDAWSYASRPPLGGLGPNTILGNVNAAVASQVGDQDNPLSLANSYRGAIAEILIYDQGLSEADIAELSAQLWERWNVGQ